MSRGLKKREKRIYAAKNDKVRTGDDQEKRSWLQKAKERRTGGKEERLILVSRQTNQLTTKSGNASLSTAHLLACCRYHNREKERKGQVPWMMDDSGGERRAGCWLVMNWWWRGRQLNLKKGLA